jgi:AraC family transcriptional regulator
MAVSISTHPDASLLRYHRHGISFTTIVLEGSFVEVRDGKPCVHSTGSVVLRSSDEEHADYFTSAGRCLNVEVDEASATASVETDAANPHARRAAYDIVRAVSAGATASELRDAARRMREALVSIARAPQPAPPEWLRMTIERFGWSSGEPLYSAAKLAGVHPVHFSREFHRYVRMTPTAFRRGARVRRASELLLSTNARLAIVAQECGFSDQSHLTREFGSTVGLSPASFRRTFAR